MSQSLILTTRVKNIERFEEVVQYAQNILAELNQTHPDWWEISIEAEKCIYHWFCQSYKGYDVLAPYLTTMYNHFNDVVFIETSSNGVDVYGTYRIEGGVERSVTYETLCLALRNDADAAKMAELLAGEENASFCKEHDIQFTHNNIFKSFRWIYDVNDADIVKEYASRIISGCADVKCYFMICDYYDRYRCVTQVCTQRNGQLQWEAFDEEILHFLDATFIYEFSEEFQLADLVEPSEDFKQLCHRFANEHADGIAVPERFR